jgi:hypothetical protein
MWIQLKYLSNIFCVKRVQDMNFKISRNLMIWRALYFTSLRLFFDIIKTRCSFIIMRMIFSTSRYSNAKITQKKIRIERRTSSTYYWMKIIFVSWCENQIKRQQHDANLLRSTLFSVHLQSYNKARMMNYNSLSQKDNDNSHDTRSKDNVVQQFKVFNWIITLFHSSQSSNLNSMKAVWNVLKQQLRRKKWSNKHQLKQIILKTWDEISMNEIRNRIVEMFERCEKLIRNEDKSVKSALWWSKRKAWDETKKRNFLNLKESQRETNETKRQIS